MHEEKEKLKSLLDATSKQETERPVCAWLKEHPLVLARGVCVEGHPSVVAEFPLGNDYRADFVALGPFSGGFDIHFCELEPPDSRLFTKDGKPASRLNGAMAQISEWKVFIEKNRPTLLHDLSKFFKERELVIERGEEPTDHVGWHLYHPRVWLKFYYHIIIGRRDGLSDADIERKAAMTYTNNVDVLTYDRLIHPSPPWQYPPKEA